MKYYFLLAAFGCICFVSYAQSDKSKKSSQDQFQNNGDYFVQKKNLVVERNLYVLKNFELTGDLKTSGLSYFKRPVSIGSFDTPTETLDVFGNIKSRGTIFSESFNNRLSGEVGEDLKIGRDLFVTRYGYFEKVGIGVSGTLTESLEVNGSIQASERLISNALETNSGAVANDLSVGGQIVVEGTGSFSDNLFISGQVGIGTSTPTEKLEIDGNIKVTQGLLSQSVTTSELSSETASISSTLDVEGATTLNNSLDVSGNETIGGTLEVTGVSNFNTEVNIGGKTLISGNVGIGNTAPTEKLDVTGNAKVSQELTANTINSQQVGAVDLEVANTLNVGGVTALNDQLSVSGTTTIDGNLGLGVDAPAKKLDVAGDGQVSGAFSANFISSESFSTSNLEVSNTLTVDGLATFNDNLNLGGTASIGGNVLVDGNLGLGISTPSEKLDVLGNAKVSETLSARAINSETFSTNDLVVENTFTVGGASTLNGALDLNADADISGKLNVGGNSLISGNLGVGTTTPTEKLDLVGNANISETLTASTIRSQEFSTENLDVSNALSVGGATSLKDQLTVSGNSILNGNLGLGLSEPTERLDVSGNARISQTLTAQTINSETFSTDNLMVQKDLEVLGNSAFTGGISGSEAAFSEQITVSGNTLVNGSLGIGTTTPAEKLDVAGSANISETLTASTINAQEFSTENLDVSNALSVGGATSLNDQLTVSGNSILNGNLGLGLSEPTERLDVSGNARISQTLTAQTINSDEFSTTNLDVSGLLTVGGATSFNDRMDVTGNAVFSGNVGIGKAPEVGLDVSGDIRTSGSIEAAELKSGQLTLDKATIEELHVTGQTSLDGPLTISGESVLQNGVSISGVTYVDGKLGIGNAAPGEALEVAGNASVSGEVSADLLSAAILNVSAGVSLTGLSVGEDQESFLVVDADGNVYSRSLASFQPVKESETNVAITEQTLSVGTDVTPEGYQVAVDGNIITNELTIQQTIDWPDYVFEEDYRLQELKDVETYIKTNKHLPEVPSAAEVEEKGVQVGEMNAILLKKIEELTLHMIEKDKKIRALEMQLDEVEQFREELREIKNLLTK